MRTLQHLPLYLWALPATAVGLVIAFATMLSGGSVQVKQGIVEAHGGFARWLLRRAGGAAMTFGHVILGRDLVSISNQLGDHAIWESHRQKCPRSLNCACGAGSY